MGKMNKILFIVEGPIEENFLTQLKMSNRVKSGRVKKFNIMQKVLKPTDDILSSKMDCIYCIVDTDDYNASVFVDNVKSLSYIGKVVVLVQCKNFEDEMLYMIDCNNITQLCNALNVSKTSKKDLKHFLANDGNFCRKLTKEQLLKYCERIEEFRNSVGNRLPNKIRISMAKKEIIS